MGKYSEIVIGLDHYCVGKATKSTVNINDDAFTPEYGTPWKIFKRRAGELDATLRQRILDKIAALNEVCTAPHALAHHTDHALLSTAARPRSPRLLCGSISACVHLRAALDSRGRLVRALRRNIIRQQPRRAQRQLHRSRISS